MQNQSRELGELFAGEAIELLRSITQSLVELEREPGTERGAADSGLLRAALRAAHTLKGSASAIGARRIELVTHDFETCAALLGTLALEGTEARARAFDLLYRLLDETEAEVVALSTGEQVAGIVRASEAELRAVFGAGLELRSFAEPRPSEGEPASGGARAQDSAAASADGSLQTSFRIAASKIERPLAHTDDLLRIRGEGRERARETKELLRALERLARGQSQSQRAEWMAVLSAARDLERRVDATARNIDNLSEALTDDLLALRMVPLRTVLSGLERVVRDAARQGGKRVGLRTNGGDTEVDRNIAETLRVALLHLVRNAVDHGIETPFERSRSGKEETGSLVIDVDGSGGRLQVRVSDDGRGIDLAAIRKKAQERSLDCKSDEDAYALIFQPGFTTKSVITETSGRGVGLDAVRDAIELRGGTVSLTSRAGRGTEILLAFPSSRLTMRVVVMKSGEVTCAIPAAHVESVVRLSHATRVNEFDPTIIVGERVVALYSLPGAAKVTESRLSQAMAVVIRAGQRRAALLVDEAEGDQDVVVGPLSPVLADVRELGGAAALADGRVVAVLRGSELLDNLERGGAPTLSPNDSGRMERRVRRILVVDDSVTTRTLEKSILEAEGYAVEVAVNGVDALERLRQGTFDLIVSDVEMPQMGGLELVRRVRQGPLAALPIVLMSSLAKDEDRARGLAAGANEYLVKSEFQQARLLSTLERLL